MFSRRICEVTTDCYLPLTADGKENAVVRTKLRFNRAICINGKARLKNKENLKREIFVHVYCFFVLYKSVAGNTCQSFDQF